MRYSLFFIAVMLLLSCSTNEPRDHGTLQKINEEMKQAADSKTNNTLPESVSNALLPPLKIAVPKTTARQMEQRFDLVVNDTPANQVLMSVVSGTRYSMLIHPNVTGNVSVNLKDVTVFEVLDALRTLYGYEYKLDGTRIFVESGAMQTRVFQVNYISAQRRGASDTRVISGSVSNSATGGGSNSSSAGSQVLPSGSGRSDAVQSTSIATTTNSDFWAELTTSLAGIVGSEGGRRVVTNPQSGIVVVRGMPSDIRNVEEFLRLMQLNIERQVILEAKIINVQLNDQSQNGVNWALFGNIRGTRATVGSINNNSSLAPRGEGGVASNDLGATAGGALINAATTALGGPLFAVALQGASFAALLSFLDSQGNVQVLSSPRIATINNQKAVLKVGTDEFFVTGVSTSTTASTGATTTVPEVTLQPFFSGIALDVMPQIDKDDNIILHIHPSVSQVSTVNKQISLGGALSSINLPLASSNVSETDSIVRTRDGQVIAIGGLMTESTVSNRSKVPVLGDAKG
ncbi:MAG TPA: secretin N-terminal domain-containing protein, partial [Methylophilaceae bacterium]|nr:secretin N-terminal domain-containing protein [Methylophilaceae bacterium]